MGPTGYLPSSNDADLGQMPLSQIREAFELQAEGLIKGSADALLIETSQDILEVKLAVEASHTGNGKNWKKSDINFKCHFRSIWKDAILEQMFSLHTPQFLTWELIFLV